MGGRGKRDCKKEAMEKAVLFSSPDVPETRSLSRKLQKLSEFMVKSTGQGSKPKTFYDEVGGFMAWLHSVLSNDQQMMVAVDSRAVFKVRKGRGGLPGGIDGMQACSHFLP